jgi:hypothetical protein
MFSKLNRIIKFSLLGAIGFGAGGAILGYIRITEESWFWVLGLAAIGVVVAATLGFFLGGWKKASNLAIYGAIAGVVGGYLTSSSDFEPWLQMAIVGLIFGITLGVAFAMLETRERKSNDRELRCGECNSKIGKNDKYCPNCGIEFE